MKICRFYKSEGKSTWIILIICQISLCDVKTVDSNVLIIYICSIALWKFLRWFSLFLWKKFIFKKNLRVLSFPLDKKWPWNINVVMNVEPLKERKIDKVPEIYNNFNAWRDLLRTFFIKISKNTLETIFLLF